MELLRRQKNQKTLMLQESRGELYEKMSTLNTPREFKKNKICDAFIGFGNKEVIFHLYTAISLG